MTNAEANAALAATTTLQSACADFRAACEANDGAAIDATTIRIREALAALEALRQPLAQPSKAEPLVVADVVCTSSGGDDGNYWEATVVVDGEECSGYSRTSGVDAVIDALQRYRMQPDPEPAETPPDPPRRYDDSVWRGGA